MDGSSFRRLGARWGVGATTAWRRIQRTEREDVVPQTLVGFSLPREVPVLMLDAKHFRFEKKPWTLYVAFDAERMRPLCWILLPRNELRLGYDRILKHLRKNGVHIQGAVSDWHRGILAAMHDHCPSITHQRCAFHVMKDVRAKSGGRRTLSHDHGRAYWKAVREIAIEAASLPEAARRLRNATGRYPEYRRGLLFLEKALPHIYEFVNCPALTNHRTSNRIENFMGCLEQRMKTMRGMKTPETCIRIISSWAGIKYREPTGK